MTRIGYSGVKSLGSVNQPSSDMVLIQLFSYPASASGSKAQNKAYGPIIDSSLPN
jgi:hypothetical protein